VPRNGLDAETEKKQERGQLDARPSPVGGDCDPVHDHTLCIEFCGGGTSVLVLFQYELVRRLGLGQCAVRGHGWIIRGKDVWHAKVESFGTLSAADGHSPNLARLESDR